MDPILQFKEEVKENVRLQGADPVFKMQTLEWIKKQHRKYTYNFNWLGRPIIQYPQDIVAMQEIIWSVKPDLIIETGIAHGGSLILYASLLEMIGGEGRVLGIDIDIRDHNRTEIEKHPMFKRIDMIEGSSIDQSTAARAAEFAKGKKSVLVCLDSNHSHEHVLAELELYAPLVSSGSYCVVFDTIVEDLYDSLPEELRTGQLWTKQKNPKSAVREYISANPDFSIDKDIENKIMITACPDGFLKRK